MHTLVDLAVGAFSENTDLCILRKFRATENDLWLRRRPGLSHLGIMFWRTALVHVRVGLLSGSKIRLRLVPLQLVHLEVFRFISGVFVRKRSLILRWLPPPCIDPSIQRLDYVALDSTCRHLMHLLLLQETSVLGGTSVTTDHSPLGASLAPHSFLDYLFM